MQKLAEQQELAEAIHDAFSAFISAVSQGRKNGVNTRILMYGGINPQNFELSFEECELQSAELTTSINVIPRSKKG